MSLRNMFRFEFDPGAGYVVAMLCVTAAFAACEMASAPHILVDEELAPLADCPECICPVLECPSPPPMASGADRASPPPAVPSGPSQLVDLNHASPVELTGLPGVGPGTAARIIEYRSRRPFKKTRDVMRIRGIGRRKYAKIKQFVTVGPRGGPQIRRTDRD